MRHGKKINHLGRKSAHRKAMLSNMASSLIEHKRINTTVAKAKALKNFIEPLVTKAKTDNTHNRRVVFSYLKNKNAVTELFREVAAKVGDRPGGYTRIIKTGNRLGDNAEMCMIELVDFNEVYTNAKKEATKSKRRRRGGSSKAKTEAPAPEAAVEEVAAEAVESAEETVTEDTPAVEEAPAAEETVAEEAPAAEETKAEEEVVEEAPAAEEEAPETEASTEDNEEEKKGE